MSDLCSDSKDPLLVCIGQTGESLAENSVNSLLELGPANYCGKILSGHPPLVASRQVDCIVAGKHKNTVILGYHLITILL